MRTITYCLIIACSLIKAPFLRAQELGNTSILPTEILLAILEYVPKAEDIKNLRLVSHEFRNLLPIDTVHITYEELNRERFLCNLFLYQHAKRVYEALKHQKNNVSHLIVDSGRANIIPLELTYFKYVEKITLTASICAVQRNVDIRTSLKRGAKDYVLLRGLSTLSAKDSDAAQLLQHNQPIIVIQQLSSYFEKLTSLTLQNIPDYSKAVHRGLGMYTSISYATYTISSRDGIQTFENRLQENAVRLNNKRLYLILAELGIKAIPETNQTH